MNQDVVKTLLSTSGPHPCVHLQVATSARCCGSGGTGWCWTAREPCTGWTCPRWAAGQQIMRTLGPDIHEACAASALHLPTPHSLRSLPRCTALCPWPKAHGSFCLTWLSPSPAQTGLLSKGAVVTRLLEFHAGGVVGLATSPCAHLAVTAGRDGTVRVFDYAARALQHTLGFSQPATVMSAVGADAQLVAVGFKDGVVRGVLRTQAGLRLVAALKPHKVGMGVVSWSIKWCCRAQMAGQLRGGAVEAPTAQSSPV